MDVLVDLEDLLVNLRVPDRHRGLVGEGGEQIGVVAEEGIARALGTDGENPIRRSSAMSGTSTSAPS